MSRSLPSVLLIFLINCCIYTKVYSLRVPSVICPSYFQYFIEGSQYIGRLTVPNVGVGTTRLDVRFTQRTPVRNNYYGKVSLYESYDTTIARIERRQPVYYRVAFPTQTEIPKLTLIAVNGQIICRDNPYPAPTESINLDHTLMASINTPLTLDTRSADNAGNVQRRQQQTVQSQQRIQPSQAAQLPAASSLNFDCGRESTANTVSPFIYGGKELFRGQFPWLAAIYLKRAEGLLFICGGSLVSTRTVISAAHCFGKTGLKASQVLVVLGHHDLNNFNEDGDKRIEVAALHMHPEYSAASISDADLAILQLKSSVRFTAYIQPVCFWRESDDLRYIAGHKASVAGWGEDENQRGVSPIPKVVEGDIASDRDCQDALRSSSSRAASGQRVRSICVSNSNGDGPCRGDSGGGLIMKRNGRWTLRGVVSFGVTRGARCHLSDYVYFCDVAKHSNWLRANIV